MRDVELFKNKTAYAVSVGEIIIPDEILEKWQGIVNILADLVNVPAALITKIEPPNIEVFRTSASANNPFHLGDSIRIEKKRDLFSYYCEKVFSTKAPLHIANALEDEAWDQTLGPQFDLISYLGVPILSPDGSVFGTICVMDTQGKEYHANYVDLMLHFKDLVESHLYLLFQQSSMRRQIIDLNRMDEELQQHRDHLEDLVAKRTQELAASNVQLMLEIDERKLAEKALQESEERFRSLVENSLTGISIYQNGRLVYQNPEHERLLGAVPEAAESLYPDNVHPEDVAKVKDLFKDLVSGNVRSVETDFRFYPFDRIASNSDMRWVQCRATLVNMSGRQAILTNMMDISRTRELEHLMRIEDKMSSLGRVAAGIVHEIRNPLSAINMYLGALKTTINGTDAQEPQNHEAISRIAARIQSASNKMESVIGKVMDFSKPTVPRRIFTNINKSIDKALDLSAVAVRKAGVKMEKALARDLPSCYADSQMLEDVFLNLINNAMQALAKVEGPRNIRIASMFDNQSVIATVSDSGPGVPPALRHSIFDPFFTTKGDGSGIGLSLVRRMVMDHSSSLAVSTAIGVVRNSLSKFL